MDTNKIAKAFNEWMRRYTEEPEKFEAGFRTVNTFLQERSAGTEPSYGEVCTAYLQTIINEQAA
jgi:hypothetical protein